MMAGVKMIWFEEIRSERSSIFFTHQSTSMCSIKISILNKLLFFYYGSQADDFNPFNNVCFKNINFGFYPYTDVC